MKDKINEIICNILKQQSEILLDLLNIVGIMMIAFELNR